MEPLSGRRDLVVIGLSFLVITGPALAAPPSAGARADALFKEAKALLVSQKYAEACPKLAESQSLDPATGTLLALALCHEGQGRIATADKEFEQVIDASLRENRPDRAKLAREHAVALEPMLPKLVLTVAPEVSATRELAVECDGRRLQRDEWNAAAPIDPGDHVITASAPNKIAWRTTLVLQRQETKVVIVPALKDEAPVVVADHVEGSSSNGKRTAAFVLGGVGVVALGVGIGFGILALQQDAGAHSLCPALPCAKAVAAAAWSADSETSAWVADIAIGAGAALIVTGVVLLLTGPKAKPPSAAWLAPIVTRDFWGGGIRANF